MRRSGAGLCLTLPASSCAGIQTQTAECLVIGEIVVDKLIVALNKVDLFPAETRAASLARVQKGLAKVFERTRFAGCPMVVVAARPGGGEGQSGVWAGACVCVCGCP